MPIEIVGMQDSVEFAAAEDLRDRLKLFFRATDEILLIAGAQCWNRKSRTRDVDILAFGSMSKGLRIPPLLVPKEFRDKPVYLSNFAFTLEIKDQRPQDFEFHSGNQVDVRYKGTRWYNASAQASRQKYAVINFLKEHRCDPPQIEDCIWLRGCNRHDLPSGHHNIFPADLTADDLIRFIVAQNGSWLGKQSRSKSYNYYSISCTARENAKQLQQAAGIFRKRIKATPLDRQKLERICKRVIGEQQYASMLGRQLLIFRGRGGTGKTVRLLQVALDLHDHFDARVLFLTYNKALVADVQRLFAIRGITDRIGERTIHIQSSTSYFSQVFRAWDLLDDSDDDSDYYKVQYPKARSELRDLLRLATPNEVASERTTRDNPDVFLWDYVIVDEGQDWPVEERDLLLGIFGPEKMIIADGRDQFVQGQVRCNWRGHPLVTVENSQIVPLTKALRLSSNLCRFVQSFADEMDVDWDVRVNDSFNGGRVILLKGEYTQEIHQKIFEKHFEDKNLPVDSLICVTGSRGADSTVIPDRMSEWGCKTWNGLNEKGRSSFPTETSQYRIVKYESCRGLEGWTVVCLDFDRFYERLVHAPLEHERQAVMQREEDAAKLFAARWCMIPVTRAMDTLVLQARNQSFVTSCLDQLAEKHQDFVEVIQ